MLFAVSYLDGLILIVRTVERDRPQVGVDGGSGGYVVPDFYEIWAKLAEGLQGVAHWNHDIDANAQKVNAEYKKRYGEFLFRMGRLGRAGTLCSPHALERAQSTDPRKVRDALAAIDVSSGYAAMAPAEKSNSAQTARMFTAVRSGCDGSAPIWRASFPRLTRARR